MDVKEFPLVCVRMFEVPAFVRILKLSFVRIISAVTC